MCRAQEALNRRRSKSVTFGKSQIVWGPKDLKIEYEENRMLKASSSDDIPAAAAALAAAASAANYLDIEDVLERRLRSKIIRVLIYNRGCKHRKHREPGLPSRVDESITFNFCKVGCGVISKTIVEQVVSVH
jgi:hypothetical protein